MNKCKSMRSSNIERQKVNIKTSKPPKEKYLCAELTIRQEPTLQTQQLKQTSQNSISPATAAENFWLNQPRTCSGYFGNGT